MLIHSIVCLAAGAFSLAAPSGTVATASAAAAPTAVLVGSNADTAPMSFESVLARLEQVEALRVIAKRSGREDRVADLDALEARLYAMAEQIASAPLHAAAPATGPAAPGADSSLSFILTAHPTDPVMQQRRVFEGDPTGPLGEAKPAHSMFSTVDRSRNMMTDPDRRRVLVPFARQSDEKNPLEMTGTGRRPVPAQRATAPGMGMTLDTGLTRTAEGAAGTRRTVAQPAAAPSAPGAAMSAAAGRNAASIDRALRDLRSDLVTAPR